MVLATKSNITEVAAGRWRGSAKDQRTSQLIGSLVEHLHAFARENQLTMEEWFCATDWLARAGQISNDKRKEFILLSDVLGLSMLLELSHGEKPDGATQSTLLGPFFAPGSPEIAYGGRLPGVHDDDGVPLFVSGQVRTVSGRPIPDAVIDTWQTDHEGLYEAQLPTAKDFRHRGLIRARGDGRYMFRTVAPVDYPIPTDGPVGELLRLTSISCIRPAHIHFKLEVEGHAPLITHVFDRKSRYLTSDPVYGTRDSLVVDLVERPAGTAPNGEIVNRPFKVLELDLVVS